MKIHQLLQLEHFEYKGWQLFFGNKDRLPHQLIVVWTRTRGDWWTNKRHTKRQFIWKNQRPKGQGFEFFIGRLAVSFRPFTKEEK